MTRASAIGTFGAVVLVGALAQGAEVGSPDSRVRAASAEARELLVNAANESRTVAQLVGEIEASDIVVVIELKPLPKRVNGRVQVAAATPSVRYLRLSLGIPKGQGELKALLGHELQHVVEIMAMPDVRDDASLAAAYRRIGWAVRDDGLFETEAALAAGRAVARELAGTR